jgi:hypothetical protein
VLKHLLLLFFGDFVISVITESYAHCVDCDKTLHTFEHNIKDAQCDEDAHILGQKHHDETGHKVATHFIRCGVKPRSL